MHSTSRTERNRVWCEWSSGMQKTHLNGRMSSVYYLIICTNIYYQQGRNIPKLLVYLSFKIGLTNFISLASWAKLMMTSNSSITRAFLRRYNACVFTSCRRISKACFSAANICVVISTIFAPRIYHV